MTGDGAAEWPNPRANPHLEGHADAERMLEDAFRSGRLAHAWLICGPRGIGKATLAFRFARYVLAQGSGDPGLFGAPEPATGPGLHVAPDHPAFRRVAAGGHADLHTVTRTEDDRGRLRTEIVVGDVREAGGFLGLTAAEGGWRVVVVDSADEMNRNAANALLKVLEEPPRHALLLLVSHAPGRLPATVRSRCRRLDLRPLDTEVVARLMARYAPGTDTEAATALAGLAEGSIGRALALAEEGGMDLYRAMLSVLDTLPDLDGRAVHGLGDRVAGRNGDGAFRTLTDLFRGWLGRLIVAAAGGAAGAPAPAEQAVTDRLRAAAGLDRWLEVWEKTGALLARADGANLDRKQVVLNIFLYVDHALRP